MYKHYLLTRFNLKISDLSTIDKNGVEAHSEQWLTERFSLFESYTLPSVINQSTHDFKWLVLFDKATPERFKRRISTYKSTLDLFEPLYIEAYSDWKKYLSDYIKSDNSAEYVITSRVDNDDLIHTDYIKNTQLLFQPQDDIFISLYKNGIQYGVKNRRFRVFDFVENHFISRVERAESTQTVLNSNHTLITKMTNSVIKSDKYENMWIELVHGSNVVNKEKDKHRVLYVDNTLENYGVELRYERLPLFKHIYYDLLFIINKIIRVPLNLVLNVFR